MTMNKDGVSDEALAEMLAGLKGVTPGPWYQTGAPWFSGNDGVLAGSPDGNIAYLIADCDDGMNPRDEYVEGHGPFPLGDKDADAAHIARCDPDTIRSIITELQERRAADSRAPAVVTEEMVERAVKAWVDHPPTKFEPGIGAVHDSAIVMRAALEAALSVRAEPVAWLGTNLDGESEPFLTQHQAAFWSNGASRVHPLYLAPSIPAGYRLVPEEPTEATWRDMESAPKDGTDVLLMATGQTYQGQPVADRVTVGHWTSDEECHTAIGDCGGECRCPEYWFGDPYWMSWDGGFTAENPPNGWMPLPPPIAAPAQQQEGGGE